MPTKYHDSPFCIAILSFCKNIGVILIPPCYYWGCKVVFLACYIVSLYEGVFYHKELNFTNKNTERTRNRL
nr:MAG TPA: hypothetical protein [Caudoviricetes sp.]